MKKQNGITLIALVVTIIVLIILAGVSINLVLGDNGIITKSKEAKTQTEKQSILEEVGLAVQSYSIEKNTNGNKSLEEILNKELDSDKLEEVVTNGTTAKITYKGETVKINLQTGTTSVDEEFSIWDETKVSTGLVGKGTEEEPYLIKSASDLNYMSKAISGGYEVTITGLNEDLSENGCNELAYKSSYKLMTNIEINNTDNFSEWKNDSFDKTTLNKFRPIGNNDNTNIRFNGTFNGNGCEIKGMYLDTNSSISSQNTFGFFVEIEKGKAENLIFTNVYIDKNNTQNYYTGTLAGNLYNGEILNCYASGYVDGNSESKYVGGIAGYVDNSTVKNCINYIEMKNGIYTGGICWKAVSSTIESCTNNGNLYGWQKIGGIVGETMNATISNCKNKGNISTVENTYKYYIGGIVGNSYKDNIENSINIGTITFHDDTKQSGGIAGLMLMSKMSNSTNKGKIIGNGERLGAIVGDVIANNYGDVTITNCKNEGELVTTKEIGEIVGYCSNYDNLIIK